MKETGAQVMGVDWRFPLDQAWSSLKFQGAVQGNLDPVLLFAGQKELRARTDAILRQAGGRPGHIFNLGHGILPETPVENVRALVNFVRELSAAYSAERPHELYAMSGPKSAILLLAHGSPESPADIPEFMKHITGGRPVSEAVMKEITHRYSLIGKSPLTEITMRQAEALQASTRLPVYVGMRNWKPFISDAVQQMVGSGVNKVVAICLAPQNSSTSVGLYSKALTNERNPGLVVQFVESWHDHPLLIQAFAERLEPVWRQASAEMGRAVPVIFTAHSVPMSTIHAGDPYESRPRRQRSW